MLLAASPLLPDTFVEWFLLVSLIFGIIGVLAGIVRYYIVTTVRVQVEMCVQKEVTTAVNAAVAPLVVKLDAYHEADNLQLQAMNGEMGRIRDLEEDVARVIHKVENGLTHRQIRIEDAVNDILRHHAWDGTERRSTD